MSSFRSAMCALILLVPGSVPAAESAPTEATEDFPAKLTLMEAKRRALAGNPGIRALLARIEQAGEPDVQRWLTLLDKDVDFVRDPFKHDLPALPKVRAVDPPILQGERVKPLSELDPAFAERRRSYIRSKAGTWGLRIVA